MGEQPGLFDAHLDPLPPSPLAELDPAARERARMVLARQLPGRRVCSCGDLIVDAITEAGESTVVDAEPAEHGGSIVLTVDGEQVYARTPTCTVAAPPATRDGGHEPGQLRLHRRRTSGVGPMSSNQRRQIIVVDALAGSNPAFDADMLTLAAYAAGVLGLDPRGRKRQQPADPEERLRATLSEFDKFAAILMGTGTDDKPSAPTAKEAADLRGSEELQQALVLAGRGACRLTFPRDDSPDPGNPAHPSREDC